VLLPAEIDALLDTCERVAKRGCAVVLVTHKLKEICRIATHATVLQSGRVVARSAAPSAEIDRLVHAMIHRPDHERGETDDDMASRLSLAESRSPYSRPLTEEVLQIDGLSARDAEGVTRLERCTLVVNRGEIVGIAGVEGNGQSELGAVLAGMTSASAGRFFVAGRDMTHASPRELTQAGVGIVPEDRHAVGCVTGMSVADNLLLNHLDRYTRAGFLRRRAMRAAALDLMQRFDVRASGPDALFGGLSGGNQQKAVLARELTLDPLLFLLAAQPTRGLDVGAVAAVYSHIRAARDRGVGVLLISSELDELMSVADRIVVLYRGRIMGTCTPEASNRGRIGAWMAGAGEPA
jgi:simple sugar transport system ATP-binding protein